MTPETAPLQARLLAALDRHEALAIAVSGGVDSMVLAYVAHRHARTRATMLHAVGPAVPAEATARVQRHAAQHGWALRLIEAGEMDDPDYLRNPVDRCYHCKKNLYGRIASLGPGTIASGTNVDDLGDFRPGLEAAKQQSVVHPYVEAGLRKADVYALAAAHGLEDLAALPASPCLASRIETGIAVQWETLAFIERAELRLKEWLPGAAAVRCRMTAAGVVIESDTVPDAARRAEIEHWAQAFCHEAGHAFAGLRSYRRGSAFLHVANP
jgi:pyridinium-3,5-biscarboxylic acid mononucleotide sulfurtransferase